MLLVVDGEANDVVTEALIFYGDGKRRRCRDHTANGAPTITRSRVRVATAS